MKINEDNFFEIAEAIYCFCTLNHSGQWSDLYSILSQSEFRPGPLWTETRCVAENSYYLELNEKNIESIFNELKLFLGQRN